MVVSIMYHRAPIIIILSNTLKRQLKLNAHIVIIVFVDGSLSLMGIFLHFYIEGANSAFPKLFRAILFTDTRSSTKKDYNFHNVFLRKF